MVLADDNFASIAAGIAEGRSVYDNIRKTIVFILPTNAAEALARTLAVNLLVAGEIFYLFNCRRWRAPSLTLEALTANIWAWVTAGALIVMQLGFTYLPVAQSVFGTIALEAWHWALIAVLVLPLMLLVEVEKWFYRRLDAGSQAELHTRGVIW